MGEFPSGQRGQTVNLLAVLSVVRIHLPPPERRRHHKMTSSFWYGSSGRGFERRLLAACRWHAATAVAFPQKSESTFPHQNPECESIRDFTFYLLLFPCYLIEIPSVSPFFESTRNVWQGSVLRCHCEPVRRLAWQSVLSGMGWFFYGGAQKLVTWGRRIATSLRSSQ